MIGLLTHIAVPLVVSFAIGLSGIRFRRLPLIAGAILVVAYLALFVVSGIWAARCPNCVIEEDHRASLWFGFMVIYGIFAALLLLMMSFGALAARVVRWGILRARAQPPDTVN